MNNLLNSAINYKTAIRFDNTACYHGIFLWENDYQFCLGIMYMDKRCEYVFYKTEYTMLGGGLA